MVGMLKQMIRRCYKEMQQHYMTFRFLVWLKEKGITRRVNHWLMHSNDANLTEMPSEKMLESQSFYTANKERVSRVLNLLADEKSRLVMGG